MNLENGFNLHKIRTVKRGRKKILFQSKDMRFFLGTVFYDANSLSAVARLQYLVAAGSNSIWYAQPEIHLKPA
jgi:hypothetical protein